MLAREDDGPFTDNVQTLGVHGFWVGVELDGRSLS